MNARTALMEIPRCPQHKIPLIHREHPSADAYFCGTWYDCPQCAYSVLFPSKELTAQLTNQRERVHKN